MLLADRCILREKRGVAAILLRMHVAAPGTEMGTDSVCVLCDLGHQDGIDYLVMEYLEGETLAARIEKSPLPTAELLRYASQIADALDKAHRQGRRRRQPSLDSPGYESSTKLLSERMEGSQPS
jgi:serine/threonine protein kinase